MEKTGEEHSADAQIATSADSVKARLKWFNGPKGFGFVIPEDRQDVDAFLHITTLQKIGVQAIGEDAELLCTIQYGAKGAHVIDVIEILDLGKLPESIIKADGVENADVGKTVEMGGTVKWYKPEKGFGFVVPDDGLKDVFIHKTCLEKHSIGELVSGQRVKMTFRIVPKGREVILLELEEKNGKSG